jgi:two-component system, sensor histidine kinase
MPDGGFVISFTDVTAERAALVALSRANETLEARVMERTLELEDALAAPNAPMPAGRGSSRRPAMTCCSRCRRRGCSSVDRRRGGGAARAQVALVKAQNALMSVEGILDALLDISKLESGKAAVSVGPVSWTAVATSARGIRAIAAAKGLG